VRSGKTTRGSRWCGSEDTKGGSPTASIRTARDPVLVISVSNWTTNFPVGSSQSVVSSGVACDCVVVWCASIPLELATYEPHSPFA